MSFFNNYKKTYALLLLAAFSWQKINGMDVIPIGEKVMFTVIPLFFQGASKLADTNNPLGYTSKEEEIESVTREKSLFTSIKERSEVLRESKIKTLLNITMFLMTCYTLVELQRQVIINPDKETSLYFALSTIGFIYQIVNFSKAVTFIKPSKTNALDDSSDEDSIEKPDKYPQSTHEATND